MLSKNQIKFVTSLKQKKFREEHQLFIAEGVKMVKELLQSTIQVKQIYATSEFLRTTKIDSDIERFEIKENELERISALYTPNEVLAVCQIPEKTFEAKQVSKQLTLVLEEIKDPGNMGTIIRIADWFGIQTILCSLQTADLFNPKVVQATMGSIARVDVYYMDLPGFFNQQKAENSLPVYGALLEGENLYSHSLSKNGFIVIGNESNGISESLLPYITDKISIPSFSHFKTTAGEAESLNAGIATAVICSEFRRKSSL